MMARTFLGVILSAVTVSTGVAATQAHEVESPLAWYATCASDQQPVGVLGGTVLDTGRGFLVELIGPVARTRAGAVAFGREAARALEGECEPTHISELWMITRAARP